MKAKVRILESYSTKDSYRFVQPMEEFKGGIIDVIKSDVDNYYLGIENHWHWHKNWLDFNYDKPKFDKRVCYF